MAFRSLLFVSLMVLGFLFGQHAAAQDARAKAAPPPPAAAPPLPPPKDVSDKNRVQPDTPPVSWSDPRVIAELVKNCDFDAMRDRREWLGDDLGAGSTHPLTCLSGRDQSCVPDPCFTDMDDNGCRARCSKTCEACGKGCARQCKNCKAACRDDACRESCARTCANCHEGCVRVVDRCASGKCSAEYKECNLRWKAAWLRNGCPRVCENARTSCAAECKRKSKKVDEMDYCIDSCVFDAHASKPACNLHYCDRQ